MIRIVTDTGSDIIYLRAGDSGVEIVELDIIFEDFPYDYRNDLDFSVFYENLTKAKNLPRTSQANPAQFLEIFNDAKEKGDEVLVVTLSGGLSGTYASAKMAQEECGYDAITVVDSSNAIINQRRLAEYAVKLRDEGKSRQEIEEALLGLRDRLQLLGCLDTLTYLKKGGRVPPAMALIGNALKIKPVVSVTDGKVEPVDKVRGVQAGKRAMWTQLEKDGYDESWPVIFGHTNNEELGKTFMKETKEKFGLKDCQLYPVGGVIGTHTGPNTIILTYVKK